VLDQDESTAFVGIGTLLNSRLVSERIPKARKIVVFSSGVGYGQGLPVVNDCWKIYALRGPLSAQALGVSSDLAVTDGAVLLRRLYKPTGRKVNKFAYMPHVSQSRRGGETWQEICEQIGIGYVDASWPREKVLSAISETEVLLTEAMHGAITADALRVPWVCIHTTSNILDFKWQDWCKSIDVEYQPYQLAEISDLSPKQRIREIRGIRGSRTAIQASLNHWSKKRHIATQLVKVTKIARPVLSRDTKIEQLTIELEERLQKFKNDVEAGCFRRSSD
jgi:succinoglycan biosynthesis protein ExoV